MSKLSELTGKIPPPESKGEAMHRANAIRNATEGILPMLYLGLVSEQTRLESIERILQRSIDESGAGHFEWLHEEPFSFCWTVTETGGTKHWFVGKIKPVRKGLELSYKYKGSGREIKKA